MKDLNGVELLVGDKVHYFGNSNMRPTGIVVSTTHSCGEVVIKNINAKGNSNFFYRYPGDVCLITTSSKSRKSKPKKARPPSTIAHFACRILQLSNVPLTRYEILERVHMVRHGSSKKFDKNCNNCYFLPPTIVCKDYTWNEKKQCHNAVPSGKESPRPHHERYTLRARNLIEVVGKRRNQFLYGLTEKGEVLAKECTDFYGA